MLTICWAAKGGSGTSVTTAALTIACERPALAVDLAGDLPQVFGIDDPDVPGFLDWMASDTGVDRLDHLSIPLTAEHRLIHRGAAVTSPIARWNAAAAHWAGMTTPVFVDAGTGPPTALLEAPDARRLLITRQCYLSVSAAARSQLPIDGVIVIEAPGRALRADDIEMALAAPIVLRLLDDPAIGRSVDAGLLVGRLPRATRRSLRVLAEDQLIR